MARIGGTFTAKPATRLLGCQPSSSKFVPHLCAPRTIPEIAHAARGIVRLEPIVAVGAQAAKQPEYERDEIPSVHRYGRRRSRDAATFLAEPSDSIRN